MKYIIQKRPGKVNVRHHVRHLEDGNTNVVDHSRSRPTSRRGVRENIGRIPLKDLTYPQAKKRFPFLNPNGNIDGDNKVNQKDCRPFDAMRQDEELPDNIYSKVQQQMIRDGKMTKEEVDEAREQFRNGLLEEEDDEEDYEGETRYCSNCAKKMDKDRTFTDYCPTCYKGLNAGGGGDYDEDYRD